MQDSNTNGQKNIVEFSVHIQMHHLHETIQALCLIWGKTRGVSCNILNTETFIVWYLYLKYYCSGQQVLFLPVRWQKRSQQYRVEQLL